MPLVMTGPTAIEGTEAASKRDRRVRIVWGWRVKDECCEKRLRWKGLEQSRRHVSVRYPWINCEGVENQCKKWYSFDVTHPTELSFRDISRRAIFALH